MWFLLIFDDVADTFSAAFLKQGNSTAPLKTNIPWLKMPCKNVLMLWNKSLANAVNVRDHFC